MPEYTFAVQFFAQINPNCRVMLHMYAFQTVINLFKNSPTLEQQIQKSFEAHLLSLYPRMMTEQEIAQFVKSLSHFPAVNKHSDIIRAFTGYSKVGKCIYSQETLSTNDINYIQAFLLP